MSSVWVTVSFPGAARVLTTKRDGLIDYPKALAGTRAHQINSTFFVLRFFPGRNLYMGYMSNHEPSFSFHACMHASVGPMSRIQISDFGDAD